MNTPQISFNPYRFFITLLALLLLALVTAIPVAASDEPGDLVSADNGPDAKSRAGSARPGWLIALGPTGTVIDLDDQIEESIADLQLDLSDRAEGADLLLGYSWGQEFALELLFGAADLPTGRSDVDGTWAEIALDAVASLRPGARVQPYVAGGVGGSTLSLEGASIDDRRLRASQVDFGGGVEVHLSRRFALDLHYRFALQNFDSEERDGSDDIDLNGSGQSHRWGMRLSFSL